MADESSSFPVWVGNLAPRITESVLLDLFGKFGPVKNVTILRDEKGVSKHCGFVSFCSYNVCQAAAIGLDGCEVFGQIIETRGPDKLAIRSYVPKATSHENNDGKVLLDCVHFVEKKNCPFKAGQCPYRHCEGTQNTDKVCENWLNYQCRNTSCPERHPVINILKTEVNNDMPKAKAQPRCPSHNAFKCTGECGDIDCETHFMELEDMVEHLDKARNPVPSGACSGCKAVFFSEEERKKHSCFQPKHQQTPFIPIYHPVKQPNNTTCSCEPDSDGNRPVTTCESCGSCYEHSGDSLSTFECSPRKNSFIGHKCPNSPSVRNDGKQCVDLEPIGVFWDIENCPVPRGKSAVDIVKKIREEFFTNKREAEFMCVCDISKEKKEIIEDLNKSQVTVVHINATSKNAADDKLRQSLRRFAQSYPPPATVVLVSGDINFAAELSDLRHRHNLTVICLHNAQAQSALLACAHESKRFDLFTDELPVTTAQTKITEDSNVHAELTIGNLPIGKDVAQIKNRLKKLSDNCGGKVASVTGRRAVMKFPNYQCAARAKKRMENEDVFGSLIQVTFPLSKPNQLSPIKQPKFSQTVRIEESMDIICKGPQRISKIMSYTKNEIKKNPELPRMVPLPHFDRCSEQFSEMCDENLEEFMCVASKLPSHLQSLQPGKPLPSYPNQAPPYMTHASSTYPPTWQNPYCQGLVPLPPQGVGYPLPIMGPHPLTASWLANLHSLSILEQQKGGVDIVVGNLDEAVSRKELKKKLASVFREHCKVYSVVLHSGEGIRLRAFIKVPKLSDAQLAMSKVNNQQIFSMSVTVTLATEKEKELCFLSSEVTSVLKEAPLHWMPLNKFLSLFYEKSSHPFDMNVLTMLPDIVTIIGKPGSEAICLATPDINSTRIHIVDWNAFSQEVHLLLKQYQGSMLLANFAASYWLKFDKQLEVNDKGVCLSDALKDVINICIKVDTGKDLVSWAKEGIVNGGVFNKLEEFSYELQDLLKAQPQFRLPLSQLISAYQKWFNKKSPFDPVSYGFSSVKDLLEALPSLVQVKEEGVERFVVLTHKFKLKVFETELKFLLESQPGYQLPLNQLMTVYQRYFGRKCHFPDHGVDKLTDLMDKISSHVVKVSFNGNEKIVSLTESERTKRTLDHQAMETLTQELQHMLVSNKQMPVAMVTRKYYEEYGRHLNVNNTGFISLENMMTTVIPGAKIVDIKGERVVCLLSKDGHCARNLVELLSQQDGGFISLKRLPAIYRKHFNKKFPLTMDKLNEVVATTDKELQILGADNDQILCYTDISNQGHQSQTFKKLASDIHNMLIKFPGCRMSLAALADIYRRQRGISNVARRWPELSNLDSLLKAMSDSIEVSGCGDFASVCLKHEYVIRCLAHQIVTILSSYIGKPIPVCNIPKLYEKTFRHPLCTHHYGFVSVNDMMDAMCSVVKVGEGKKRACLSPLQLFAVEAKQLLTHQRGCVSLNRFAPCYQQYYNRPCKASEYGYSRLSEVIAAVPNIAEVRGKGVDKMVVMVADGDVLLECIGHNSANTASDCSRSDSPPITYEGSDTESVIVEEDEIDDTEEVFLKGAKNKDLIVLSGNEDHTSLQHSTSDWMMAPVPKTLPEPDLYPQLDQQYKEDLISFREFDMDAALTGLEKLCSAEKLKKLSHKQRGVEEFSKEDIEILIANRNAHSSCTAGYHGLENQSSLSSKLSFTSPTNLPVSPGMHDLSDVEAEILKTHKQIGGKDGTSPVTKSAKKPKPQLALSIYKDYTPSKKATPVKLAMKFSVAT